MDLDSASVQCPYCWESIEIEVDPSLRRQEFVEDCPVCCQPIVYRVTLDGKNRATVQAKKENE